MVVQIIIKKNSNMQENTSEIDNTKQYSIWRRSGWERKLWSGKRHWHDLMSGVI